MPIDRLLRQRAFQPEQVSAMKAAFEDVCRELGLAQRDDALRELVAKAVIECGERGNFDPDELRRCASIAIEKPF
jgi:hypothetical protein